MDASYIPIAEARSFTTHWIKKATYVPKNPWSQYAAYSIIHDHVTYDPYHNYT